MQPNILTLSYMICYRKMREDIKSCFSAAVAIYFLFEPNSYLVRSPRIDFVFQVSKRHVKVHVAYTHLGFGLTQTK